MNCRLNCHCTGIDRVEGVLSTINGFGFVCGCVFFERDVEREGETVVTITLKSIPCVLVEV